MGFSQVIVFQGKDPRDRAHAKPRRTRRGKREMCGLARIHILTLRLRGFASSREHRSPAKPPARSKFSSPRFSVRLAVKGLGITLILDLSTPPRDADSRTGQCPF